MDVRSLISPTVEDEESLQTFFDALIDHVLTIERDVSRLKDVPGDRDVIAELFRAVHNIKGDASLCKVDFGIAIAHPIEGLLSRLRAGEVVFSDLTAEAILLATDRLELATDALLTKRPSTACACCRWCRAWKRCRGPCRRALTRQRRH